MERHFLSEILDFRIGSIKRGNIMKKYEVVGIGTHCADEEYIMCNVINQWDFQTKCTAMGKIGNEALQYNFIKYKRKEFIAYNGKKVECYEPTEIQNPKDYSEIMDYCKRNNIQILK